MKSKSTFILLLALFFWNLASVQAQNQITYGFIQDPVDPLKLTAVAYPNFTSTNVTISTALFSFYLPAGTVTDPAVPVLPAFGSFINVTGIWRIEKITPALYASLGFNPNDLLGNDIYQCILQNSPSPNMTNGVPVSLFSFRLPADCIGGTVQVHINDNSIQMSLLNNLGININNQMSVSVNDLPAVDMYFGNNPLTDNYDCPLDDVPNAINDLATTNEDVPVNINVTGNDSFGTDGPSTGAITITTPPLHGVAVVDNNGTPNNPADDHIIYTPAPNFNGQDSLKYQICDFDNDCDIATVYITVNLVNDVPVVPNATVSTPEDTPFTQCLPITDPDHTSFTVTSICLPDAGTISGLTNPATNQYCVTYTPNANYNGPDTLCFLICDGAGACDTSYIFVTVTPVNDPPSVPNPMVTTPEDTPVPICVPITDVDNTTFTVTSVCLPDAGMISGLTNPGTSQFCLTYTPNPNYNGPDTLCISVCDASGACDTSYIIITVTPVNDPPIANDDNATTPEDTPVTFSLTANDTDVDGTINLTSLDLDPGTAGIQTSYVVAGGTFTYNPANGNVTFTPALNFTGMVSTPYTVCDTGTPLPAQCDGAIITVNVTPVNDPPIANDDSATTPEDTPVTFSLTGNDTDVDGMINPATLDLDLVTPGVQTSFTVAGQGTFVFNPANGNVTFTPVLNFNGTVTTPYNVCDNGTPLPAQCDGAIITVIVTPVNDPPIANDDMASTAEDTPVTFSLTGNDTDVDGAINPATLDLDLVTPGVQQTLTIPGQGTFTFNPGNGNVTFTPVANFNGTVTTPYNVCDTGTPLPAQCDGAIITVTVNNVNDPPIANDDSATTPEDTPVTFSLTANDTDTDGMINLASLDLDPVTPGIQTTFTVPGQGTFTYNPGNGNVTFTPVLNFNGTVTAQYNVCDTGTPLPAQCDNATITVIVTPVNDPPVANDDSATTPEDAPITFSLTGNDTDVDGMINPNTLDLDPVTPGVQQTFTIPGQGTFTFNPATGNVTFTPVPNFTGTVTTPYNVCDNGTPLPAQCDGAIITVNVNAVNDPPIANDDSATTPEDTPVTFSLTGNDTDVDGAINPNTLDLDLITAGVQQTFTIPGQGTFVFNPATGNVTFTPVLNFNGTVTTPYNVCDTGTPLPAQCDGAVITVIVTPVNDPPIANDDSATTPEDTPVTFSLTGNDTDVDGAINPNTLDLDPVTPGVQTSFTVAGQGTFVFNPATGNVTFTPVPNFNGTTTAQYNVCDTGTPLPAQCDNATITVNVNAVNDPPIANDDSATTPEDTPVTFSLTANDTDSDGAINPNTLDLDLVTPGVQTSFAVPGQGTFVFNPATGNVTFTPVANFNGTVTTPYNVCDTGTPLPAQCDGATITVTVTPVNDPPIANDDSATTPEDTPVTFSLTANDSDSDGAINPATLDLDLVTAGVQTSFTVPGQGTFVFNPANGNVTFTPVLNFTGTVTTPYNVCDTGTPLPAQCDGAVITVIVTPVNDPPVANDDNATTPEDTPVTFSLTANDSDVDGAINPATLDLDLVTPGVQTTFTVAGQGTFVFNPANGNVTFTPVLNFNGTVTTPYNVCDTGTPLPAQCDGAIITVIVTPVNDPPVANDDSANTSEDTPVTFSLTNNDTDVDGTIDLASLDIDLVTPGIQTTITLPGQGTFTYNPATGNVTFTPVPNFTGTVTTPYNVCDTGTPLPAQCDGALITVTVDNINDPPVANDDNTTTPEDTPVTFSLTANDTDSDGSIDLASLDLDPGTPGIQTTFTVPGQGTFTYNPANGNVTFTPVLNFNGTVTAQYNVCDTGTPLPAQCDGATITVIVTPVNDPPIANDDSATTPEDTPVTFSLTGNDTDVDGAINPATLDLDLVTPGVQTTFTIPGQGTFVFNPANGNVTFTPVLNFNGTVTTPYNVCDTGTPLPAQCDGATITVNVNAVNDPPIANDDSATTPEDTPVTFSLTANDTDSDGTINLNSLDLDPVTPGVQPTFTVPGQGTFTYNPGNGMVTFTPVPNFNGTVTAQYNVCDTGTPLPAQCDNATITVTVNAVNDPPIANDDSATTPEDTPVTFSLTANDTDIDGMIDPATVDLDLGTPGIQTTFVVAGGTFTYIGGGNVTFTPNPNFSGTATAQYLVCDNGTPLPPLCDPANITVTVNAVNDPPIANDDSATTPEDTPVTFSLTANDSDVDGGLNLASVDLNPGTPGIQTTFTVPGQGTFTYNGNGTVTFTPVLNFFGVVNASYVICDTGTPLPAQCDNAAITVTVTSLNDAPIANDDNATTPEDTPVLIPILNNDTDVDGTIVPGSVTIVDSPNHGTITVNPVTGAITYTPALNFVGSDTLVYNVCDSGTPVLCDNATVIISVTATSVRLLAKVRLQGSLYNSPDTLMRDNLRSLARIPKTEPYTALGSPFIHVGGGGNEMVTDSITVFANYGPNSIVDWVFIELRNPNNLTQVLRTRSALLQRDGDVVDVDGVSSLVFESTLPGSFYVAVRHRNHLGTMTANAIVMTNAGTVVDFTNLATPLWDDATNLDGYEQITINGKFALWAGNVNKNTTVVFAGQNNDKDPIFNQIDQAPGNVLHSQSFIFNGYHQGDVNMDGKAVFAGQTNDVDFIFNNVDQHPRNITHSQSFIIRQMIAQ